MRVLIAGYGDVGKSAAKILLSKGIEVTAVDIKEEEVFGLEFIRGDVLKEEFWEEIDLAEYDAIILALPNDIDTILAIMIIKKRNPETLVLARCNDSVYKEKMYQAGADYVLDLPTISSEVIITSIFREEIAKRLIFEEIQIASYSIRDDSPILGETLPKIDGLMILGVEKDGEFFKEVEKLESGMKIIVVGKKNTLIEFERKYITPSKQ